MSHEPQRWLDRLVSASVSLFMAALAIYGAVWLLCQVWAALVVIGVLASVVVTVAVIWRFRQSRW